MSLTPDPLPEGFEPQMRFKYNPRMYQKTVKIFSQVMGYDIQLKFVQNGNCMVTQDKRDPKKFVIYLNPNLGYVTSEQVFYTCEEHELAHPLFKTDGVAIERFAKKMKEKYREYGITKKQAESLARILDDQRIESCWEELFIGSGYWFKELRKGLMRNKEAKTMEIMVLAARCERKDLVHPFFQGFYDFCVNQLKLVERKALQAIFKVGDAIIQEYINKIRELLSETGEGQDGDSDSGESKDQSDDGVPVPQEMIEKIDPDQLPDEQESDQKPEPEATPQPDDKDDPDSSPTPTIEPEDDDSTPTHQSGDLDDEKEDNEAESSDSELDDLDDLEDLDESSGADGDSSDKESDELDDLFGDFDFDDSEMREESDNTQDVPITPDDIADEIKERFINEDNAFDEKTDIDLDLPIDMDEILNMGLDDVLDQAEQEFNDQMQVIEKKLSEFKPPDPTRNTMAEVDTKANFGRAPLVGPYLGSSDRLKKIFQQINLKDQQIEELDIAGELDLDQYIQFVLGNADPDVFFTETEKTNMYIVLVIDGSYSMGGDRIQKAKRIALTMKRAVVNLRSVEVDTWIFAGSGEKTPIRELKDHEIKTVGVTGYTHTNDAVRYISQQAKYRYRK